MSYKITIVKIEIDLASGLGNVPYPVTSIIYEQTVDQLDIAAVVKTANTYGPNNDKGSG